MRTVIHGEMRGKSFISIFLSHRRAAVLAEKRRLTHVGN